MLRYHSGNTLHQNSYETKHTTRNIEPQGGPCCVQHKSRCTSPLR